MVSVGSLLILSLLASRKNNQVANYLLSGLVVLFCYYALIKILSNTSEILDYPDLIRTYRPLFILACSIIYLYCKALTTHNFKFVIKDTWHLVPFLVYALVMIPFFVSDEATKIASLSQQPFTFVWFIERGFWLVIFVFYSAVSFRVLKNHKQKIKDIFSTIEHVKLNWLRNLLILFFTIWMLALVRFLTAYGKVGYENKLAVPILMCLIIFLIAIYALRQPEIFDNRWDNYFNDEDFAKNNNISGQQQKYKADPHHKCNTPIG